MFDGQLIIMMKNTFIAGAPAFIRFTIQCLIEKLRPPTNWGTVLCKTAHEKSRER
jgi:hypothetical protein